MGIFEAMLTVGTLMGTVSSSFVFNAYGYMPIYVICLCCLAQAWIFIFIFMPESITNCESDVHKISHIIRVNFIVVLQRNLRSLFDTSLAMDTIRTTIKRREKNDRAILFIIISVMGIFILTTLSNGSVIFLYLREKFQWTLEMYTLYGALGNVSWIIGTIIGTLLLHKFFKIDEEIVIFLGFCSGFLNSIILGIARKNWQIFAGD